MTEILALLQNIAPLLEPTTLHQMSQVVFGMLVISGRITMLGLSCWTEKGGSYRTIQRFYHTVLPWEAIQWLFFQIRFLKPADEHIIAGDEVIVSKAGKETHGLDRFFSGLQQRVIPGLSFFAFSLVNVREERSYPLQVTQVVKSAEEKAASMAKAEAKKKSTEKRKPGRPKGSKNKDKREVELHPELLRIQTALKRLLATIGSRICLKYVALDGHFGNYPSAFMVRQVDLHLISKLRLDAVLYPVFEGEHHGPGPKPKYGEKLDMRKLDAKYLKETSTKSNLRTDIYQGQFYNKEFAFALNVVIILKTNLLTQAQAHVILFSTDLELDYAKLIKFYSLRFQIEIVCTQMTKTFFFTIGAGWDDISDFNFFVVNDHSINQQFYQLPTLVKIQMIQGWLNTKAKLLDVVCQYQGLNLFLGLVLQLSQLLLETVLHLRQFLTLALEFVSHDDFRKIHFQETFLLTFQTIQGLTDGSAFRLQGLRQPFSGLSTFQFMGNQIRVVDNAAEILPDEFIQLLRWHITSNAAFTLCGSMNVSSPSTFVIVVFPLGTAGRRQTTLSTTNQAPKKVIVALVIATGHILVFLQTSLCSLKHFLVDNGWNGDCNPLFLRGWPEALTLSYGQQGRSTLACRDWPSAPTVGCTNIRRGTQHVPNCGLVPALPASWCWDLLFVQLSDNPVNRDSAFRVSIPGKDLPNNVGFDRVNLYSTRITRALRIQDISIRRSGPRQQCSGSQFCLPPTPHPVSDQVALIFGYRPTDLQQELIMGIVIFHWALQKLNVTTQVVQFFNQQNLMNIFASQAIRSGYQNQFECCHAGSIPQPIQARTIELGTGISIIPINMLSCQLPFAFLGYSCLQTFNLLFYALALHLTVGRYSGIQGDLHGHSPDLGFLWIVVPSSSAEETDRHNPNDAAHRDILQLCDELAILFSSLLLNIRCYVGEAYPKSLFSQPQRTMPPRQLQLSPSCQAEFVICDQTIEFNFRDAKQYWGLEDFMNVKETAVTNAANLSLFMVNFSYALLQPFRQHNPDYSILDLKSHYRGCRYASETIKWLPLKPDPILLADIFLQIARLGAIHSVSQPSASP